MDNSVGLDVIVREGDGTVVCSPLDVIVMEGCDACTVSFSLLDINVREGDDTVCDVGILSSLLVLFCVLVACKTEVTSGDAGIISLGTPSLVVGDRLGIRKSSPLAPLPLSSVSPAQ